MLLLARMRHAFAHDAVTAGRQTVIAAEMASEELARGEDAGEWVAMTVQAARNNRQALELLGHALQAPRLSSFDAAVPLAGALRDLGIRHDLLPLPVQGDPSRLTRAFGELAGAWKPLAVAGTRAEPMPNGVRLVMLGAEACNSAATVRFLSDEIMCLCDGEPRLSVGYLDALANHSGLRIVAAPPGALEIRWTA